MAEIRYVRYILTAEGSNPPSTAYVGFYPHGTASRECPTWEPTITLGGWYDGMCPLPNKQIPLKEFLTTLGITLEDVRTALEGGDTYEKG